MINKLIRYCLENKVIVGAATILLIAWGIRVAPFDWDLGRFPRDPVPLMPFPILVKISRLYLPNGWGGHPEMWKTKFPIH